MPLGRRTTNEGEAAQSAGSGIGLLASRRRRAPVAGRICGHCGAEARIDMIDMARTRAYLTCRSCGNEWDTDRLQVLRSA